MVKPSGCAQHHSPVFSLKKSFVSERMVWKGGESWHAIKITMKYQQFNIDISAR